MRNNAIRDLVFASIIVAIIVFLSFTMLGFITYTDLVSITIIHIPVLVGAIMLGKKVGVLLGTVFGICSMILAFMVRGGNAPFTNPLLSILPRVLFGWYIYPLYLFFNKKLKRKETSTLLTMITATIFHSLSIIPFYYLFGVTGFYFFPSEAPFNSNQPILEIFTAIFSVNSAIEIALAAIVGTPIVLVLDKLQNKNETTPL